MPSLFAVSQSSTFGGIDFVGGAHNHSEALGSAAEMSPRLGTTRMRPRAGVQEISGTENPEKAQRFDRRGQDRARDRLHHSP
jgi:hypothetical protein